jgi:TNF receptor-associated protein 1
VLLSDVPHSKNTIDALWSRDPKEVKEEDYFEFYKYIANAVDDPLDVYHFRADAPIDIKALFFIPSFHTEKYGMERMTPGVSLYSRKVLIEANSPDILPEWLRFIKGVVDSEDLPLAISREKTQDSALIQKLRKTITRKFIAHLSKMLKDDRSKYIDEFYKEYAFFLKEGICQDYEFQSQLSKLLFFETAKDATLVSLDEYVARMTPEQKDIYYLVAPNRAAALASPYLEAFNQAGVDVLVLYTAIEDFVMANLTEFEGRKLVSVEKGDINLSELKKVSRSKDLKGEDSSVTTDVKDLDDEKDAKSDIYVSEQALSPTESIDFCQWFKRTVGENKVSSCTSTDRLTSFPAIVTDNESGAMRRMMRLVDTSSGNRDLIPLPKQHVEINAKHPIIVGIYQLSQTEPTLAKVLAEQIYDNCLVAAGLLDDSRTMLPRLNDILMCVVKGAQSANDSSDSSDSDDDDAKNTEASGPVKGQGTVMEEAVIVSETVPNPNPPDASATSSPSAEESSTAEKKKNDTIIL